MISKRRC